MYYCLNCGKELEGRRRKYCSQSCYFQIWYYNNKEKISKKRKENYISHPKKTKTKEEKLEYAKKYRKEHSEQNKIYVKKYYEKMKNNEEFKEKRRQYQKAYHKKKKMIENDFL